MKRRKSFAWTYWTTFAPKKTNVVLLEMENSYKGEIREKFVKRSERIFAAWTWTRSLPRNGGHVARYDPSEIQSMTRVFFSHLSVVSILFFWF